MSPIINQIVLDLSSHFLLFHPQSHLPFRRERTGYVRVCDREGGGVDWKFYFQGKGRKGRKGFEKKGEEEEDKEVEEEYFSMHAQRKECAYFCAHAHVRVHMHRHRHTHTHTHPHAQPSQGVDQKPKPYYSGAPPTHVMGRGQEKGKEKSEEGKEGARRVIGTSRKTSIRDVKPTAALRLGGNTRGRGLRGRDI